MSTTGLEVVRSELKRKSCHHTNWADLGIPFDQAVAQEVVTTAKDHLVDGPSNNGESRPQYATSLACRSAARKLMSPLIGHLFGLEKQVETDGMWDVFHINYYNASNRFSRHFDFPSSTPATVVIASLSGVRSLSVEGNPVLTLNPQSVTLLDGLANPVHSADCVEAPSISVVADVRRVMY